MRIYEAALTFKRGCHNSRFAHLAWRGGRQRLFEVGEDIGADLGGGHRPAEEKALHLIGVGGAEEIRLIGRP